MPASGSISLITQSGALGNALLQGFQRTGLGLRMWISSGNEIDLDVIEISRMLLDDDETQVIALFVEALRDGERFLPLARLARERGKAIVVRRAGRSDAGRMASATHTGKMAGSARVWAGLVRQGGLIEVGSIDEMLDVLLAFEVLGMPAPHEIPGLGVVSVSGGVGVVIADEATDHGLPLPAFLPATQALLREHLGTHIALDNPLDTSYISESAFCKLAESLLQDPAVGTVLMVYMSLLHDADKLLPPMLDAARHARATGKHLLLSPISANDPLPDEVRARLLQAGVLTLPSVERSVAALGTRSLALRTETGQEQCAQAAVEPGRADVAEAACIPAPAQRLCTNLSDAMQFAASCGYPVALKVDSPDIPHKTEVGGVALGIVDEAALQHAWDLMNASIARNAPHADVKGYLVQKMIDDAVELITGCSRDAEFGPVMMIGWGGIHAEILQDMQFLALPARRSEIVAALQGLRVHKVLAGARGKPPADTEAAIDAMLRLSEVFLARTDLSEIDLNPLLVRPKGHGIAAVDVLAA